VINGQSNFEYYTVTNRTD